MSGSYTQTPNLGLFKPTPNSDTGTWGYHLNSNADTLDSMLATTGSGVLFVPIAGGTMSGALILNADPTATSPAQTAATKHYVDASVAGGVSATYVPLSGGTMTGLLLLSADPGAPLGAATKQYVDGAVTRSGGPFLPIAGGTLTGSLTGPNLVLTATPNGTASISITQSQTVSNSVAGGVINTHTTMLGSRSTGFLNWSSWSIDVDRVAIPGGATGYSFAHGFGGGATSTMSGGRTGLNAGLTMGGDTPTASGTGGTTGYYVAFGAFNTCSYWNGGSPGDERGSVFGANISARTQNLGSIGSYGYRSTVGLEVDVGAAHQLGSKTGVSVVEWSDSNAMGYAGNSAFLCAKQINGTAPGFDQILTIGWPSGWWPLNANSTIIGNYANTGASGGPAAVAAVGIDFTSIAIGQFGYKQQGAAIDGNGNVGGLTTYGNTLQTQGTIQARSASVNTITVVRGGEFSAIPTLTVSAPPSGATATATVATMGFTRAISMVGNRGTGYAVGNLLTLVGGTFTTAAQVTVAAVDTTGAIIAFTLSTPGSYSVLPTSNISLSGGAGTGAAIVTGGWAIATVNVTAAGSGYPEFPPPLVASTIAPKYAEPMLAVSMNGAAAPLTLNATAITTSAPITTSGIVTVGTGAATVNSGTGAPSATRPVGSIYMRTDGTAGARLYVSAGGGTWAAVAGV